VLVVQRGQQYDSLTQPVLYGNVSFLVINQIEAILGVSRQGRQVDREGTLNP